MAVTFDEAYDRMSQATSAVRGDAAASPVLRAVIEECHRKLEKTKAVLAESDRGAHREAIVELEEAGDCAKAAAEADTGLSPESRQAVVDAHLSVCMLKAGM